jgi:hypothetical protein
MEKSAELEEDFPGLRNGEYAVTSPIDPGYNCVAWAVGDTKFFWYDAGVNGYYWPPGVSADTLAGWIEVFGYHGYRLCADSSFELEFEKIAIYALETEPQHVARQKSTGVWSSKMGSGHDIEHTLESIEGEIYGSVQVIMKRVCKGRRVFE